MGEADQHTDPVDPAPVDAPVDVATDVPVDASAPVDAVSDTAADTPSDVPPAVTEATGVTPQHELEAALDEPPGSTQFSGASAGIKAEGAGGVFTPDVAPVYEKPQAAVDAEARAMEVADEVRGIQLDVHEKNVTNVPNYPIVTAYASKPEDGDAESITFAVTGGELILIATSKEMRFGREEAAGLQRAAAKVAGSL